MIDMLNLASSHTSQVIAYEVDARMVAELQKRVMGTYDTECMHVFSITLITQSNFVCRFTFESISMFAQTHAEEA